jgi:LacI family transcriptional regulator
LGINIKDVAKAAGVSPATASRALGNYGYVSTKAREKILAAAKKLNYKPHAIARSMVTGRTKTVGFIVGDIENPFFAGVAESMNAILIPEGYNLMVYTTNENLQEEQTAVIICIERRIDSLMIAPTCSKEHSHIDEAIKMGIPVVLVDRALDKVNADIVAVENFEGTYEAIKYLIGLGHTEIGFLTDSLDIRSNKERLDGYVKALNESNIQVKDTLIMSGKYTIKDGYRGAIALINNKIKPTAIFASNNFMTEGLLFAAKDMGIKIPEELAILGFDDMDWYKLLSPSISVVAQPIHEIGETAARCLLQRMFDDTSCHKIVRLPTKLVIRESTGKEICKKANLNT